MYELEILTVVSKLSNNGIFSNNSNNLSNSSEKQKENGE
jgi:hypothetical protein